MREIGDEQQIAGEARLTSYVLISVGQERNLGECKKRYSDRQDDRTDIDVMRQQQAQIGRKEIGIFEITQQRQIGADCRDHEHAPHTMSAAQRKMAETQPCGKIEGDRSQKQRDELIVPPAVEKHRRNPQPGNGEAPIAGV